MTALNQLFIIDRGNSGDKVQYNRMNFYLPAAVTEDFTPLINGNVLPEPRNTKPIDNIRVIVNGKSFKVGALAMSELSWRSPVGMNRYSHENFADVLTTATLSHAGASGEIAIVTGLPVDDYNEANKQVVKNHFMGKHRIEVPQRRGKPKSETVIVTSVNVIPETLGTYYNLLLDNGGNVNPAYTGRIGLIDVGRYTACLVVIDGGKFDAAHSQTTKYGMQEVHNQFSAMIHQATSYRIPLEKTTEIFNSGTMRWQGGQTDVSAFRDAAIQSVTQSLINTASSVWQDAKGFDFIGVTGGAAHLYHGTIKTAYSQAVLVENAVMANCWGMTKWGKVALCQE